MKHDIIVLFGGRSDERHVSVASAQNIVRALEKPLCWFWAPGGAVHDVSAEELMAHKRAFEHDYIPSRPAIWPDLEQALDTLPVENPVFLLALHGGEGEDGTVQRWLEERGIPYTGSDSSSSEAAFDKSRAKEKVKGRVKLAESRTANGTKEIGEAVADMLQRHRKIVLKPLSAGSSRGLFFLERGENVHDVVEGAGALGIPYIIEQFVDGKELTVGVIDEGDGPFPLPVVEIKIDPGHTFDYDGKYLGKGTHEIVPADIPESMAKAAQEAAVAAHIALGCEGYSRTDIMAADDGIYFLELNTLPGLTTSSLVPQELRVAGIEFRDFLEKQVELAVRRVTVISTPSPAARSAS